MNKGIITVSREFGSGGRAIGRAVAEKLGYAFYDRELIEMAARKSGLTEDYIEHSEQKVRSKFFHNLPSFYGGYLNGPYVSLSDRLYMATAEAICEIAEQGSCVIVGRCADYILKDKADALNVFVYADIAHKTARATEKYGLDPAKAEAEINRTNKYRANHYNYYTGNVWGDRSNYHLCVDSGALGEECAIELIALAAQTKFGKAERR